jgi:hypothetical protein
MDGKVDNDPASDAVVPRNLGPSYAFGYGSASRSSAIAYSHFEATPYILAGGSRFRQACKTASLQKGAARIGGLLFLRTERLNKDNLTASRVTSDGCHRLLPCIRHRRAGRGRVDGRAGGASPAPSRWAASRWATCSPRFHGETLGPSRLCRAGLPCDPVSSAGKALVLQSLPQTLGLVAPSLVAF